MNEEGIIDKAEERVTHLMERLTLLKTEVGKVIIGQEKTLNQLLITFMASGHALLEGVPGLAKTLMIRTMAEAIDLKFRRIQFTPDLMPSDVIGTEILEEDHSTGKKFFKFNKGPVFTHILLADEINRTPPKTQSALLEAMQEFEVTYSGETYPIEKPFFILATQNPIEQAGTFPLPEAQLDRFLLYIKIDYPEEQQEKDILKSTTGLQTVNVEKVISGEDIIEIQGLVRQVPISDELIEVVNTLTRNTRPANSHIDYVKEWVSWGAGPRAGQAMILTAKANALLNGRFAVTKQDIQQVALPVLRHRIIVNFKAEAEGVTPDDVTRHLLEQAQVFNSR